MKNRKKLLTCLLIVGLSLIFHIKPVLGAGDYVTVKNDSGAMVEENGTIQFEGVSAYNTVGANVILYYNIYDPSGNLVSTNNIFKTYTSDAREIYYSYQFNVNRNVFATRGLYKIEIKFDQATGSSPSISSANFSIFVDIVEKPQTPTFTLDTQPPTTADTVNVTINQGANENPALLPLTFQYRTSIFDDWKTYTTPVPITTNGTYVYARACTTGGQCSLVGTIQVTNVNPPTSTPPTIKTPPTVYKEESRIATYYFVGFQKTDKSTTGVPVPSGTTPQP